MADPQSDSRGEAKQSFFVKQQLIESARTAFQLLSAVVKNATLYPEAHPFVVSSADKFRAKIEDMLIGRKDVAFYLLGGELFFEKLSVPIDESLSLLLEQFTTREIGGIVFKPELATAELIRLAILMNKEPAFFAVQGGIVAATKHEGIEHIELHRALLVDKNVANTIKAGRKSASDVFKDAIDAVKDVVEAVSMDKASQVRRMNAIVQSMVDSVLDNRDSLLGLTSIKMYDEYTFAHSVNTSILAVSLGHYLSLDKPQIAALGSAALMHDMGKVNVPNEIINKPGKLSDAEWQQVQRHPVEGGLLLCDAPGISKLAMVGAFEHHQHGERGYPRFPGELRLHPFSQIIALSDAYEALTAARVYYSVQMPPDNAIRILIAKRGSTFNPILVKAFVNMIGLFPIGTLLKLDTGEIGLVTHQTRDLMRPRVLLLDKFDGSEKTSGTEISLLETAGGKFKRSAVGTIDPGPALINVKQYVE